MSTFVLKSVFPYTERPAHKSMRRCFLKVSFGMRAIDSRRFSPQGVTGDALFETTFAAHAGRGLSFVRCACGRLNGVRRCSAGRARRENRSYRASRTPPDPRDRRSTTPCGMAEFIDDFHQGACPSDGGVPSERTEIRVLFDDDYLYIGARLYDSDTPTRSRATSCATATRSDRTNHRSAVVIDPFNTGRNGYRFETNANGVRHDMLLQEHQRAEPRLDRDLGDAVIRRRDGLVVRDGDPVQVAAVNPNIDTWGMISRAALSGEKARGGVGLAQPHVQPERGGHISKAWRHGPGAWARRRAVDPGESAPHFGRGHGGDSSDTDYEPSLDVFYRITPR